MRYDAEASALLPWRFVRPTLLSGSEKKGVGKMKEMLGSFAQEAYRKGQELKQRHESQQAVVGDTALMTLAADFAQLALCQKLRDPSIRDAHTRAMLRIQAFERGYRGEASDISLAQLAPLAAFQADGGIETGAQWHGRGKQRRALTR